MLDPALWLRDAHEHANGAGRGGVVRSGAHVSEAATSNHADGKRLLRRFKTRFHLARDARLDLSSGALSLGIQVSISPPEMSSTLSAPPTIETNRLASLVGAFVDPNGGLWYQRVLAAVRDLRLATGVPWQEETAARLVKPLESSSVILQYNDLELTERDLYLIVAKGTFFAEIEPEKSVYEDLTRAPLVHQMLHFHFLSFTDRVFDVCDELYQLCRGLDLSEGGASADLDDSERRCCIYCLNEEGAFSRPEHVFSEAL